MAFTRIRVVSLADLTNRAHADLSDAPATAHHTATVAGDLNLADLAARAHADLSDSPADAHHDASHTIASHSDGTVVQTKVVNGSRTGAAGSGDQAITGAGFAPTGMIIFCLQTTISDILSFGLGDSVAGEGVIAFQDNAGANDQSSTQIVNDGGDAFETWTAVLKSMDADGCTLTWTEEEGAGDNFFKILFFR